jgi:hypothetical protein
MIRRPRKEASSSYFPLFVRFGSLIFDRAIFLKGIKVRICEMQLSRALRLSSDRKICQGDASASVASNIMSRARE